MTSALLRRVVTQHLRNAPHTAPRPRSRPFALRHSALKTVPVPRTSTTRPGTRVFSTVSSAYGSLLSGKKDTLEFRLFFSDRTGTTISPWHDIPLFNEKGLLNFICEIPKETSAKMEVATDEENTPIKQDIKNDKLRYYPYNINWNYGLLPQTWEDPDIRNIELDDVAGDNDPVDVVEIGATQLEMGGVYTVKPLGVYAMIDDGELDWKVIAINVDDPKAAVVNDVEDVEREFPGELEKIMIWFRDYKMPDGKPANAYGYGSKCMNREFCMEVIQETNEFWKALKSGSRKNSEELSLV